MTGFAVTLFGVFVGVNERDLPIHFPPDKVADRKVRTYSAVYKIDPKAPCTDIVEISAVKCLYRDPFFKA